MRAWTAAVDWLDAKNGLLSRRWQVPPIRRDRVLGPIHYIQTNVSGQVAMLALGLMLLVTPTTALAEEPWVSGWPSGQPDNEITALAVAPSDGRVIYASTKAALYRSGDGGASWKKTGAPDNIASLAIDPKNPDVVYICLRTVFDSSGPIDKPDTIVKQGGLRKSIDGGQTWSDPSAGTLTELVRKYAPFVSFLVVDPANPQTLFAGVQSTAAILRSADGGKTWKVVYTPPAQYTVGYSERIVAIVVHPVADNLVYAAIDGYHAGGMQWSDDRGLSWRRFSTPNLWFSFPAALALDPTDPKVVYAAYQAPFGAGGVFRTGDGGASWSKVREGPSADGTAYPQLIVDPLDPRVLYLSLQRDKGGVFRTTNGGESWSRLSPEGDSRFKRITALGYSATEQMLYAGTKEGVWQREVLPAIADSLVEYYDSHDGWRVLGRPFSPPIRNGGLIAQYFEKGRLEDHSQEVSDPNWRFMYGLLADELQGAQANLPVGGEKSTISYADIRILASPDRRTPPPASFVSGMSQNADGSVFVPYDAQLQRESGHNVPNVFWSYINRSDLFPSGWLHDIGLPMTEAVEGTVDKGEAKGRKITIQAFQRTVLTYDPLNPTEWQVERANVGSDYLNGSR